MMRILLLNRLTKGFYAAKNRHQLRVIVLLQYHINRQKYLPNSKLCPQVVTSETIASAHVHQKAQEERWSVYT